MNQEIKANKTQLITEIDNHQCASFTTLTVTAASMWTKREMVEFKDAIRKEGGDAIIKVMFMHPKS